MRTLTLLFAMLFSNMAFSQGPPPGSPGGDPLPTKAQWRAILQAKEQAAFDAQVAASAARSAASASLIACINVRSQVATALGSYIWDDKAVMQMRYDTLATQVSQLIALQLEVTGSDGKFKEAEGIYDEAKRQMDLFETFALEKLWRNSAELSESLFNTAIIAWGVAKSQEEAILADANDLLYELQSLLCDVGP